MDFDGVLLVEVRMEVVGVHLTIYEFVWVHQAQTFVAFAASRAAEENVRSMELMAARYNPVVAILEGPLEEVGRILKTEEDTG